jgi:hypothetical protein
LTAAPHTVKLTLGKSVSINLYKGNLDVGLPEAKFYIFFGYALDDGTIVYNSAPVTAELTK